MEEFETTKDNSKDSSRDSSGDSKEEEEVKVDKEFYSVEKEETIERGNGNKTHKRKKKWFDEIFGQEDLVRLFLLI